MIAEESNGHDHEIARGTECSECLIDGIGGARGVGGIGEDHCGSDRASSQCAGRILECRWVATHEDDVAKSGGGEAIDDGQTNLRGAAEEDGSLGLSEGVTHDGVLSR